MPRLLRGIFRRRRELLLDLSQGAAEARAEYMRIRVGPDTRPGIVVSIATSGDLLQWHPHGHILMTDPEAAPAKSRCPPSWARLISKVYQADPLVCKGCGGPLKIVAYITDELSIRRNGREIQAG